MQRKDVPDKGRRGFWRQLLGVFVEAGERCRGVEHQSLQDIDTVPDAVVAEMIPVWMEGQNVEVRGDGIYRVDPECEATCLHRLTAREKAMVRQYGCGRNLQVIADRVARERGVDRETAFRATRDLFVRLCQRGICRPAAAHVTDREKGGEEDDG